MKKIIDLSLAFDSRVRGFEKTISKRLEEDGWNATRLDIYSHAGTHMDAPFHFGVSEQTIDKIPVEHFIGQAWVVDARNVPAGELITVEQLGRIRDGFVPGDSLLVHTGWSRFVGKPEYRDSLPRIGEELAGWCASREVRMLGVEPPSVADVNNPEEINRIHRILLGAGIIIIEGLSNLEAISMEKVELIALPLKIAGGDGAPARVVAIETH